MNNYLYITNQKIFDINKLTIADIREREVYSGNQFNLGISYSEKIQSITSTEKSLISGGVRMFNGTYYLNDAGQLVDASGNVVNPENFTNNWDEFKKFYDQENGRFVVKYKYPNWTDNISIFFSKSVSASKKKENATSSTTEPAGIILTQDISFNTNVEFSTLNNKTTISGNDYFISFYRIDGKGLYENPNNKVSFIKDVKIMGELNGSYVLPGNVKYANISLYGTMQNQTKNQDYAIFVSDPGSISFENNMSIIAKDGSDVSASSQVGKGYSITAISYGAGGSFQKFVNYGTLLAGDGGNGSKGQNGSQPDNSSTDTTADTGKNATPGTNGADGGDITFNKATNGTLTNNGIVVAGKGGNGGAGGTGGAGRTVPPLQLKDDDTKDWPNYSRDDPSDDDKKTGFSGYSDEFYKAGNGANGGGGGTGGENSFAGETNSNGIAGGNGGTQSGGCKGVFNFWTSDWWSRYAWNISIKEYNGTEHLDVGAPGTDNWLDEYNTDRSIGDYNTGGTEGSIAEHLATVYGKVEMKDGEIIGDLKTVSDIQRPTAASKPS